MSAAEIDYVVDAGSADAAETLRICLRFVADRAGTFECDVPSDVTDPEDVVHAGATLRGVARHPGRNPPATGVLEAVDPSVWDAFVTFAPHALDGSVWASGGGLLVTFADAGGSVVVRLDPSAARRLSELLTPAELVPATEWRARRRR